MDTNQNLTPASEEQIEQENLVESKAEVTELVDFSDEEALFASESEEFNLEDDELDSDDTAAGPNAAYSDLPIDELLANFKQLIDSKPADSIRKDVELIKAAFYKQYKQEAEKQRKQYLESGGDPETYQAPDNAAEATFKNLFNAYKAKRTERMQELEGEKEENYKKKLLLIEELRKLVDEKEENLTNTFAEFRELQKRWKEVGPVPQSRTRDIWDTYNHHVEKFYDYIKINRELRDLDLKKNLEAKQELCEKVEELEKEELIVPAFRKLQKYHEQWREIGPVPHEFKDSLWERFKLATTVINKKHQDFFESQKGEQQKNFEEKVKLCEKIEEINANEITSNKEWTSQSKTLIELQKEWKKLGQASRKDNAKLYERFRKANDTFFANKRQIFSAIKKELENNLKEKIALCERAEELSQSEEWKKTTDLLINLQKQWKEVGVVPRKVSEEVWQRFRKACDAFFERKSKNYSSQEASYGENLRLKEDLVERIKAYVADSNDVSTSLSAIKEFQQEWSRIGFVPIKEKERVQQEYRKAIDEHFKKLRVNDKERKVTKFKSKVENIQQHGEKDAGRTLRSEREKIFNQIRQLEGDVALWENNIGFFAKSKNADAMIADVNKKIERARQEIVLLEEKIQVIDKQFE